VLVLKVFKETVDHFHLKKNKQGIDKVKIRKKRKRASFRLILYFILHRSPIRWPRDYDVIKPSATNIIAYVIGFFTIEMRVQSPVNPIIAICVHILYEHNTDHYKPQKVYAY
jgi:hypothetical protein